MTVAAAIGAVGPAIALSIDFEDIGTGAELKVLDGTEYSAFGVTFSSSDEIRLVKVGGAVHGFYPGDRPKPTGALGDYFLATDLSGFTDLTISLGGLAQNVRFDMVDIDGPEIFNVTAFALDGSVLGHRTLLGRDDSDDVTGDQVVTTVAFGGLSEGIHRIEILGTATRSRNIGIAFDNFEMEPLRSLTEVVDAAVAVPVPASLPLLTIGLAGFGALSTRRRRAG
ncbi:PEP-CTERM sorting domain-containing protein [Tropicimonas sp. IMCC6043]|uniref:PEP-CTERM sorting domain-containing protein n=1 Tax=Tropicimonas sp. IMCC6043 TaxID=2510645 RepID=UPI00101C5774|nr:PEP-CTERM sorting domain-containing protein [Tropicimonas sp. IMCC6043]RYH09833.1 PEP-CTERM sorting domain-containing protein [Tropicimonas sp. IMCC6043]